jgi:hypothetical protein
MIRIIRAMLLRTGSGGVLRGQRFGFGSGLRKD